MARKLKVVQLRSRIGLPPRHRATLRALGLRRIRHTVEHEDTPTIRGMLAQVGYCVEVKEA